jgi:hypothetical protein
VTDVNLAWLDTSCVCDESSASVAHKCCDEKEFFVQIEDAHQASSTLYVACHHFDSIATPLVEFECSVQALSNETKVQDGPDPPDRQAIFKRNCAFIFYG